MPDPSAPADDRPPRWWLVTWNTYGTWLPGDPRGFQTWRGREYVPPPKRYAKVGEATYDPAPYRPRRAAAERRITQPAVRLAPVWRGLCVGAFAAELDRLPVTPAVLSLDDWHAHALWKVGGYPNRTAVGRLKAAASRLLHACGQGPPKVWAQGCHMDGREDEGSVRAAFRYVRGHADRGAVVHTWFHPFGEDEPAPAPPHPR